jgi:putative ABC transport system ATP-binding protein
MVIFQELHRQGITIVLVTHDPDIARHSERIISLKDGRILSDEVVQDPLDARELLAAMPQPDVSA